MVFCPYTPPQTSGIYVTFHIVSRREISSASEPHTQRLLDHPPCSAVAYQCLPSALRVPVTSTVFKCPATQIYEPETRTSNLYRTRRVTPQLWRNEAYARTNWLLASQQSCLMIIICELNKSVNLFPFSKTVTRKGDVEEVRDPGIRFFWGPSLSTMNLRLTVSEPVTKTS